VVCPSLIWLCNGRVLIANYEMVKKLGQQRAAAFRTVIVDESHHLKVGSDHSFQAAGCMTASGWHSIGTTSSMHAGMLHLAWCPSLLPNARG